MRRRARDYASRASWVPGENISVVQRGGVKGSHTLSAAGMQMFVNCVSNLGRLPTKTLQELYNSLTGKRISRGRSYCCSHAGRGAHKNCATMVCNFDSKELAGSIYTGKMPDQVSSWQLRGRVSRWQPRERLNRIARYIASGRCSLLKRAHGSAPMGKPQV